MPPFLSRIAKNASWLLAGEVVIRGSLLLIFVIVARTMGAAGVGVFSVAISAVMVAVPLLALGQLEVLVRETARGPDRARALLAAARRGQLRLLAFALPAAAVAVLLLPDPSLRATFLCFLPFVVFRVAAATRGAVFRGLDRMDVEVRARAVEFGVSLVLVLAAALAGGPVWTAALALSAGAAAGLAWLRWSQRHLPLAPPDAPPPSVIRQGLPFVALTGAYQLLLRSDMFLLAAFGLSQDQLGLYGAAAALVWGLLAAPQLAAIALYPSFSRLAASGRKPLASALAAGAVGLALGGAAALGLSWLHDPLIQLLFGRKFLAAAPMLDLLAWALPAAGASMALGVVVASWHRQNSGLVLLTVMLAASVALNLVAIPRAGALGAAGVAVIVHSAGGLGNLLLAAWPRRRKPRASPQSPAADEEKGS